MTEQPTPPPEGLPDGRPTPADARPGPAEVQLAPEQGSHAGWTGPGPGTGPRRGRQATVVNPSTRVTVAFPFSTVRIQEPDEAVAELASLVARLARALAESVPATERTAIAEAAERLAGRLRRQA